MAEEDIIIEISEPEEIVVEISEGGHGSSASIKDHLDVSSETPNDGDVLKYNSSEGKYKPQVIEGIFTWDSEYECWV